VTTLRILHVDDDPDMREVIEISLGLDPGLVTRSCSSGQEALVAAIDWLPDIILCDVRMPLMDGPTTLMRLRENAQTAGIPVIFMTAGASAREFDRLRSLGALGVIPKPFDPMTLAASVRSYVQPVPDPLEDLRIGFLRRVRKDVISLSEQKLLLRDGNRLPDVLHLIKCIAHSLSGAGGIYGFAAISDAAAALEDAVIAELADPADGEATDVALDGLIAHAGNCGNQIKLPSRETQPHDHHPVH
jgi:CheY-like chemotaxis protein